MRVVQLDKGIIYGPVNSRRLGRSLGVNLLSFHRKVCPYDCVYCQLRDMRTQPFDYATLRRRRCRLTCARCPDARTQHTLSPRDEALPDAEEVVAAIRQAIQQHPPIDNITFSGNGEPTIHPQFAEIVAEVRDLRNHLAPPARLAVLSCAATVRSRKTVEALRMLDTPMMKLDAGDELTFQQINRPCPGVRFTEVVEGLREVRPAVVQSMMIGGPGGNQSPEKRDRWLDALATVRPASVQIYSISRVPAEAWVQPVPREELEMLAIQIRRRLPVEVTVY